MIYQLLDEYYLDETDFYKLLDKRSMFRNPVVKNYNPEYIADDLFIYLNHLYRHEWAEIKIGHVLSDSECLDLLKEHTQQLALTINTHCKIHGIPLSKSMNVMDLLTSYIEGLRDISRGKR